MKKLLIILGIIALLAGIFLGGAIYSGKIIPSINAAINELKQDNTTIATGIGESYDWAIMNAIENAVRQTSSIKITQDSPMQFGSIKIADYSIENHIKNINAKYSGHIDSYKVLSSEEKEGKFYITIEAIIKTPEEYKSPDLASAYIPTVAVLDFKGKNRYSCGSSNISKAKINKFLTASLNEQLGRSKKFKMLSRKDFDNYAKEIAIIDQNLSSDSSRKILKNISIGDYILVGNIMNFKVIDKSEKLALTGEVITDIRYDVSVSYKLLETATMKIITNGIANKRIRTENANISCDDAFRKINKDISSKISDSILNNLFHHSYESVELKTVKETLKTNVKKRMIQKTRYVRKEEEKAPVIKLPFDK